MYPMLDTIAQELDLDIDALRLQGVGALPSTFAVTDLAAASLAAAGLTLARLVQQQTDHCPLVSVDRRLASLWFATSLRPQGWRTPPLWDAIAGDYPTRDGWIRLHTNAAHHRRAALDVLGTPAERTAVAAQVARWDAEALESAVVQAGGCAAKMRSWAQWCAHPQGCAVNQEPLVIRQTFAAGSPRVWSGSEARPLAGVKVLDLTRIIAGPTASRLLAGFGAQVLRIDPPGWEEPSLVAEVTLGKRCARLDLHAPADREVFARLLGEADVLLHGYRADALEDLGFGAQYRRQINPGLVDVSLNAYGCSGPWQMRRGFDSLVQMSTGIAREGMRWQQSEQPVPLPVQALDHATGYLMAAEAIRGLEQRMGHGSGYRARLSLARTARLLVEHGTVVDDLPLEEETAEDLSLALEQTPWGPAKRLKGPLRVGQASLAWDIAANALGSCAPHW
ncbi:CoA transferase [Pseudomonas sp. S75]|uniref:CoA transferase n=1 Tax=unclassified Pseudomonas TaxID=196821 RepID=UPI00190602A6|nr:MULTISPECIES: CoA transferase [unclassified Pseudomonas]MBJ9976123.1 CoA transferase [Pseudomonas sp. S30]MBK0155094.1 CoA transferase [Pseudomonas sp. S75]